MKRTKDIKTHTLLFEIGTEELPAAYLPGLTAQLEEKASQSFKTAHIRYKTLRVFATYHRLVLRIDGLAPESILPAEEFRGPANKAAFDESGAPTKALEGFLKSKGGKLKEIKIVDAGKAEYVYWVKPPQKVALSKQLPALLTELIPALQAPKSMRWDNSGVRFARPVRWLLALLDNRLIRVKFGAVNSASATQLGHPLKVKKVAVKSITEYDRVIKASGIILDADQRRASIEKNVIAAAARKNCKPVQDLFDHGLLEEVTYLTENPTPLTGDFDTKYLTLPREVLLASMAKHQRVFALESRGKIRPHFVAVMDGKPGKPALVRTVCERILNARLSDSLLFWEQDTQVPIDRRIKELSNVTFHEKLGNMAQKSHRMQLLVPALAQAWHLEEPQRDRLSRSALLAKADLVTALVKEFPTLQGTVGRHYALSGGESKDVAEAISEQYLPLAGSYPKSQLGNALALIEKFDTLAGYFSLGIEPTGDQDPFGLRRAALGIIEILWRFDRPFPFDDLWTAWQQAVQTEGFRKIENHTASKAKQRIFDYLKERLFYFGWPATGSRPRISPKSDRIAAVLATGDRDLNSVIAKLVAVSRMRSREFQHATKVIERTANIIRDKVTPSMQIDPQFFEDPLENQLWECFKKNHQQFSDLAAKGNYVEATDLFGAEFYPILDQFFASVLVNAEKPEVRANRLALLRDINKLYTGRIADLSMLRETTTSQDEEQE